MPCNKCGCATELVDSSGGTKSGSFREEYECARGHKGFVRGDGEAPAHEWTRTGTVFSNHD